MNTEKFTKLKKQRKLQQKSFKNSLFVFLLWKKTIKEC